MHSYSPLRRLSCVPLFGVVSILWDLHPFFLSREPPTKSISPKDSKKAERKLGINMAEDFIKYRDYTEDLVVLLREDADDAKKTRDLDNSGYNEGYLAAMRDVLSLIKQQAKSFNIDDLTMRLDDLDPERDLT